MYDDLIKAIRQNTCHFDACGMCPKRNALCLDRMALSAADAIEELQKVANKLLEKYQEEATNVILECSVNTGKDIDRLNEEVRTLKAQIDGMPQPSKEE